MKKVLIFALISLASSSFCGDIKKSENIEQSFNSKIHGKKSRSNCRDFLMVSAATAISIILCVGESIYHKKNILRWVIASK